jgi:sugar O-acyltransferase (sialic acid O-acetyltransferase NeuD family)
MKNLIIVGGGGMGRDVYSIAKRCYGYEEEFIIKGYIDDNLHSMDGFEGYPSVLGTIDGYAIQSDDVFVCSLGSVQTKKILCEKLKARGAKFQTLISKMAIIQQNAQFGDGTIVAETALVGSDAKIGENCLIQSFSVIGHDCELGDYVRIDTHAVCVGGVKVDSLTTVHTGAVLNHNVVVGEGATVAANSFVIKEVKPGTTVWGNPAKFLSK